jgi:PAS domain S-box-containing protein
MKADELFPAQRSPIWLFFVTISAIFIAEVIAMNVVAALPPLPYYQVILIDAGIMLLLIFPVLYLLSTRPLLRHIQQRVRTETILETRLRFIQYSHTHTLDELLQLTLDEIETLTGSTIGYFHFPALDQKSSWLRAWSINAIRNMSLLEGKDSYDSVDQAGMWTECIRTRQPVIRNDRSTLPHRKGLPEGHITINREMAVPIIRDGKILAILGVGNRPIDYSMNDVETVSTLADFAWEQILYKQAADELLKSEEKFRTLVDWTYDWEFWVDPQGNLVYTSPSCTRITGYSPDDFIRQPDLIMNIVHPEDRLSYMDHRQLIHNQLAGMEKFEYRILTRDNKECWIEHICRPLFSADNQYLGRRVSNRDVTERKLAEETIRERNEKEKRLSQTIHTMQLDIARDLHDTIGQNISYLRLKLDFLAGKKIRKQAEMQLELQSMARAANESYDLIRGTLALLQSDNSTDLFRLFTRYAEQIEERASFKMVFSSHGEPRFISAKRMRQLFYIYREILNNIEKHANATEVCMELTWCQAALELGVSDNGCGFDPLKLQYGGHYGLKFMRERAELLNGSLTIQSAIGSGTHMKLRVPYE